MLGLVLWIHFLPAQALIPLAGTTVLEEDARHHNSGTDGSMSRLERAKGKSSSEGWLGTSWESSSSTSQKFHGSIQGWSSPPRQ